MISVFKQSDVDAIIARINKLQPTSQPKWGKMSVDQMLAHCNVSYELVYEDKHPKSGFWMELMLKWFVKKFVVNEVPYKPNIRTGPQFIIKGSKDFHAEKKRLINYINKTLQLGEGHFDGKKSHSFGVLSKTEWNNMFVKHLEHHLSQFGV